MAEMPRKIRKHYIKSMKKFIFAFAGVLIISVMLIPFPGGHTRLKAYASGDALYYDNHVVIATTNSGALEVFKWREGEDFIKIANLKSVDKRFGTFTDYYSTVLHIENGTLFVYAVDGSQLHKYEVDNLRRIKLVAQADAPTWDWFGSLTIIDGKVASTGSKGVRIWNSDLSLFNSYKVPLTVDNAFNVTTAGSTKFLFNIADSKISMLDREDFDHLKTLPLEFKWNSQSFKRAIYNDRDKDTIYVVDDEMLRKISLGGQVLKTFDHTGSVGFDVIPSHDGNNIYFSDGLGLVTLRKTDLQVMDYVYSRRLTHDGHTMGIRSVMTSHGERIVIFNSNGIVIVDSSLNPIRKNKVKQVIKPTVEDLSPVITEPLYLKVDKNHVPRNGNIALRGGGFAAQEGLEIIFGGDKIKTITADTSGRFNVILTIPTNKTGNVDMKVQGVTSKLNYNIGMLIE